jgi:outer membrane receptor protein involved in Fe transport
MSLNGRGYRTDGYYIVPSSIQGSVDTPAGVDFAAGEARLDWTGSRDRLAFRFDALAEDRANGTVLQRNSSSVGLVSGAYSREMGRDMFSLLGYHSREIFRSSFTAIAADRQSERLTSLQRVPSEATGAAGYWRRASRVWNLLAGGDTQRVEGYSTDRYVPAGIATGGGVIHQTGGFLQTDFRAGPLKLFLGGRAHHAGAQGNYFSPSAGLAAGKGQWRVRGSVYRAFRAPTLNELYRDFRAGNAVTRANASLTPELLFGAEAGMDFVGESIRGSITLFRNSLGDLITNVTLSSTPAEVVRQRRNAGEGFSRGVEVELRRKFALVRVEGSYLYSDSRFASGLRIPQVPLHQGAAQLIMPWRGTLFAAGIRSTSLQFEDDLNRDVLPGYAVLHLTVGHRLPHGLALHLAVENLLNREYLAGKRPAPLLAAPLLWRVGLRWDGKPP